jgi:hypothetical protein
MFERLVDPDSGIKPIPYSRLTIQRRMHPEISVIPKNTLYPYLTDHPSTALHPEVGGLVERTYWFDHRVSEDKFPLSSSTARSFSNTFEVEMVEGLVRYLVNSNAYGLRDIAVLVRLFPPE